MPESPMNFGDGWQNRAGQRPAGEFAVSNPCRSMYYGASRTLSDS